MAKNWVRIKEALEGMIRTGELRAARDLIRVESKKLPREALLEIANLARRAAAPDLAIKILMPVVRPRVPLKTPATAGEQIAYAAALARVGAVTESTRLLRDVINTNAKHAPADANLQLGYSYIYQWDYEAAIPCFERYLESSDIGNYERAVARLNLASAYGFTGSKTSISTKLANEVLADAKSTGWTLLEQGSLELLAQQAIAARDWSTARDCLKNAMSHAKARNLDTFNLRKWSLLIDLNQNTSAKSALVDLRAFRAEAERSQRWEVTRDCDYLLAKHEKNSDEMARVYFGTPFTSYRLRIERENGKWFEPPISYLWSLKNGGGRRIDLATLTEGDHKLEKLEDRQHCLLLVLASDFYRPIQIAGLFMKLCPEEHYHPSHSYNRVQSAMFRLRSWIVKNDLPLEVCVRGGKAWLAAQAPCELIVRLDDATKSPGAKVSDVTRLAKLKEVWPYRAFSTRQASEILGFSSRKTLDLLQSAESTGNVRRIGEGRGTMFLFDEKKAS